MPTLDKNSLYDMLDDDTVEPPQSFIKLAKRTSPAKPTKGKGEDEKVRDLQLALARKRKYGLE